MVKAADLPPRFENFGDRLPATLDSLAGPVTGVFTLPIHLCWSGKNSFDLADERERLLCYLIVLHEGQRADLEQWLNADLLVPMWPQMRRFLGRHVQDAWEARFPNVLAGVR